MSVSSSFLVVGGCSVQVDVLSPRENQNWEVVNLGANHIIQTFHDESFPTVFRAARLCLKSPLGAALPPDVRRGCASPCGGKRKLGYAPGMAFGP